MYEFPSENTNKSKPNSVQHKRWITFNVCTMVESPIYAGLYVYLIECSFHISRHTKIYTKSDQNWSTFKWPVPTSRLIQPTLHKYVDSGSSVIKRFTSFSDATVLAVNPLLEASYWMRPNKNTPTSTGGRGRGALWNSSILTPCPAQAIIPATYFSARTYQLEPRSPQKYTIPHTYRRLYMTHTHDQLFFWTGLGCDGKPSRLSSDQ